MFQRILLVCVGNICRSPTAEYLLRDRLGDASLQISSAGLGALEDHPMDATAASLLIEHGIDASAHRGRQLQASMLREVDLVLVMEKATLPVSPASRRRPAARCCCWASG